jgi:hypothetical protein
MHPLSSWRSCSLLFAVLEIAECFHPRSMVWFLDHLSTWLASSFFSHLSGFRPLASLFLMISPCSDWYRAAKVGSEPLRGHDWPLVLHLMPCQKNSGLWRTIIHFLKTFFKLFTSFCVLSSFVSKWYFKNPIKPK